MRNTAGLLAFTALLAGCGSSDESAPPPPEPSESPATLAAATETAAPAPEPDLAACPKAAPVEDGFRIRKQPVAIPPMMDGLVKSGMDHLAVLTLSGKTVCVDTSWIEQVAGARLTSEKRFLSFEWGGYEAFGYVVVDRSGTGTVIETGNAPVTSPDKKRIASVDLSVSGFGGLNAFGVWQIEPANIRKLALFEEGLPPGDWSMKNWSGNDCVNLAFLPIEREVGSAQEFENAPRDAWHAAKAQGWKPAAGSCPAA